MPGAFVAFVLSSLQMSASCVHPPIRVKVMVTVSVWVTVMFRVRVRVRC